MKEQCADRGGIVAGHWNSGPDAIDVKTDGIILMTGLGLLPESDANRSGYTVDVEILMASISVFRMSTLIPCTGNSTPYEVAFQTPIPLEPGVLCAVVANTCAGKPLYQRSSCLPICAKDDVTFTFSTTACRPNNSTCPRSGQIPQIYFRIQNNCLKVSEMALALKSVLLMHE